MTSKPHSKLLRWLKGVCEGPPLHFHLPVEPRPTPRPQIAVRGKFPTAYYPKTYEVYRGSLQAHFAEQVAAHVTDDARSAGLLAGNLAVVIECVATRPRTGKLPSPNGDADNFAKGVLDAGTKAGVWEDDRQITTLSVSKRYAEKGEVAGIRVWAGVVK